MDFSQPQIGWGKVNNFSFFHPHALRKFHATTIENKSLADALQGRKRDSVTESYYKTDPKRLKEKYLGVLPLLTVSPVVVNVLDDEGSKKIKLLEEALAKERRDRLADKEKVDRVLKDLLGKIWDKLILYFLMGRIVVLTLNQLKL
ncbi:MAG: hypothetical protein LBT10_00105 [Methanobrevibacter sp.]|nr:hypothetical protein [Methanobrevibacter sp.]